METKMRYYLSTTTEMRLDGEEGIVPAEVVEELLRMFVARYRGHGYVIRSGDGWATATDASASHAIYFTRLRPAEVVEAEAAEAQGDAEYDQTVNR